ncbi:transcription activator effector binding protein [Paenibacillus vortex V453]|jgi:predicted transcriptional regulator YdeE|uniref:Transcriptional regulator n=2 Tax=Paenibacillus TaxID=44249 RepID=A0A163DKL7_9BACL|nr:MULTISPECIES: GyrI-like domain-containing protein [Paenibacillus]MCA4752262.1 effector binding domain-containing protein [Mycolicibacterium fortuitum]AVV58356.1 transcriptional regulator [Paenibacillus glucanolyticus]AWP27517.1 transcriptional regulator [Paenibacillus sp. Cedars]EFU40722.1 transcription activator effector binding protein [Paenibacillus vortex V453]ETT42573.1 transcription activator effector-binding protein [Paenibacillus sp. FSL R5-808]
MADYILEEKDSFTVLGIGTELKSNYTDYAGINKEKADFWSSVKEDGRLDTLRGLAANDYIFAVNEAVNNKMMHYAGVMTEASLPEATRVIQFPKGEYLVVKGEAKTAEELSNTLTGIAFGQVLPEAKHIAYVGGPNTTVEMGERNGFIYGELWIPVVRK